MVQSLSNLNLATSGATSIFTNSYSTIVFMPTHIIVHCNQATNVTGVASISIGTNAPNYDNILPITPLTGLTTAGDCLPISINQVFSPVANSQTAYVNVTTPINGTSQTAMLYIDGFYGM